MSCYYYILWHVFWWWAKVSVPVRRYDRIIFFIVRVQFEGWNIWHGRCRASSIFACPCVQLRPRRLVLARWHGDSLRLTWRQRRVERRWTSICRSFLGTAMFITHWKRYHSIHTRMNHQSVIEERPLGSAGLPCGTRDCDRVLSRGSWDMLCVSFRRQVPSVAVGGFVLRSCYHKSSVWVFGRSYRA